MQRSKKKWNKLTIDWFNKISLATTINVSIVKYQQHYLFFYQVINKNHHLNINDKSRNLKDFINTILKVVAIGIVKALVSPKRKNKYPFIKLIFHHITSDTASYRSDLLFVSIESNGWKEFLTIKNSNLIGIIGNWEKANGLYTLYAF